MVNVMQMDKVGGAASKLGGSRGHPNDDSSNEQVVAKDQSIDILAR